MSCPPPMVPAVVLPSSDDEEDHPSKNLEDREQELQSLNLEDRAVTEENDTSTPQSHQALTTTPTLLPTPTSPRPSLPKNALLSVPPDLPAHAHQRRCSARLLSLNVREALRQLRQKEHRARVASLAQRHADFYRRQRCCEGAVMAASLCLFTVFSLYVVFAYGFFIGKRDDFQLAQAKLTAPVKMFNNEGDSTELLCESSAPWEWCRWIHYDRFCDFEWKTSSRGVVQTSCDFPDDKVAPIGSYEKNQCGIRISDLGLRDRGLWICEVEKYHLGFSRRYGEVRSAIFNVVVKIQENRSSSINITFNHTSSNGSTMSPLFTRPPPSTRRTPSSTTPKSWEVTDTKYESSNGSARNNSLDSVYYTEDVEDAEDVKDATSGTEDEEYKRQFFLLKVFILGGISSVLLTLAVVFWAYFMYLWRSWETNKRDLTAAAAAAGDDEDSFLDFDACDLMNTTLLHSRRKSVTFAVARLQQASPGQQQQQQQQGAGGSGAPGAVSLGEDRDSKLSFDITHRSVPIGGGGSSSQGSRSGSSITLGGGFAADDGGIKFTASPTPSAPVIGGEWWRRGSMEAAAAAAAANRSSRRLSLAPEDALWGGSGGGGVRSQPRRLSWKREASSVKYYTSRDPAKEVAKL